MTLFCFGAGYSARVLAAGLIADGWRVIGTSRSADGMARLAADGIVPVRFDGEARSQAVVDALGEASHVLVSVSPDSEDAAGPDPVLRHHAPDLLAAPVRWVGYLSTTGVYGDCDGAWVDETMEPTPLSRRSRQRVAAERAWRALAARASWRLQIFRLAGIYGPGRSPLDRVRTGAQQRVIKSGQVFNRIHVDDIARAVRAGMDGAGTFDVYNVSDDEPAPPQDVVTEAARLLGIAPPPEVAYADADLGPMARSFYDENKRVRNDRLKRDLGVELAYPTYREGLKSLV